MLRERLAELDPIIQNFRADYEGDFVFTPDNQTAIFGTPIKLNLLEEAIDLFCRVKHLGLQQALKDLCYTFEIDYHCPEGWSMRGVGSCEIVIGTPSIEVKLNIVRENLEDRTVTETDEVTSTIVIANKAERYYVCKVLSGINVNLPVWKNRDLDFKFTFDGKELAMVPLEG